MGFLFSKYKDSPAEELPLQKIQRISRLYEVARDYITADSGISSLYFVTKL